ncbi:unnamed protein product [Lactuca saligna]|uniref:Uncharacterized protein n=1 Tax=Lactuca saligna TaxID=75948 RepID=A0AA35YS98_LACSI|nr:unnamed protein product [Lactuca saligna]
MVSHLFIVCLRRRSGIADVPLSYPRAGCTHVPPFPPQRDEPHSPSFIRELKNTNFVLPRDRLRDGISIDTPMIDQRKRLEVVQFSLLKIEQEVYDVNINLYQIIYDIDIIHQMVVRLGEVVVAGRELIRSYEGLYLLQRNSKQNISVLHNTSMDTMNYVVKFHELG